MEDLITAVSSAEKQDMEESLRAVLRRYEVLFPEQELNVLCLDKGEDRIAQIDRIISLPQHLKPLSETQPYADRP